MKASEIIYLMETLGFHIGRWENYIKQINNETVLEVRFIDNNCYIKCIPKEDYDYYTSDEYDGEQEIGENINISFDSKNKSIFKHANFFIKTVIENIVEIRRNYSDVGTICNWIVLEDDVILIVPTFNLSEKAKLASYISLKDGFVNNGI